MEFFCCHFALFFSDPLWWKFTESEEPESIALLNGKVASVDLKGQ
jgi:hypothetical protein